MRDTVFFFVEKERPVLFYLGHGTEDIVIFAESLSCCAIACGFSVPPDTLIVSIPLSIHLATEMKTYLIANTKTTEQIVIICQYMLHFHAEIFECH